MEKRFVRQCDAPGSCIPVTELPHTLCSFAENSSSYGDIINNLIVSGETPGPVVVPMEYDSESDVENMVSDMAADITVSRLDMMAMHINAIRSRKKSQKPDSSVLDKASAASESDSSVSTASTTAE